MTKLGMKGKQDTTPSKNIPRPSGLA